MTNSANERIVSGLGEHGFHVEGGYFDAREIELIAKDFATLSADGRFQAAGVGKKSAPERLRPEIRSDRILWFEPGSLLEGQALAWLRLQELRARLNESLFLGLWDLEGHFALYPPGGFYKRHLDRFRDDDVRTVSVVFYLNRDWRPGDGGELRIFEPGSDRIATVVEPRAGTLVCFLSDRIEHEVTTSSAERRSFAGWFRRRI